jgi:predicted RNase H-like nuclease (RuvC/YqgF family)
MVDRPSPANPNPEVDDRGDMDLEKRITQLTNENNRLNMEIGQLKKDNRELAIQIDDYIGRLRKGGVI